MQVRFRGPDEIEQEANHLLSKYSLDKGWRRAAPVPIEKLANFLGLRQEVLDLYKHLGLPNDGSCDLLGTISFEAQTIKVHSGLDPDEYPSKEGRYNFTLAHEIGHWVLHREEHFARASCGDLFADLPVGPLISRHRERTHPAEIQANRFAACLLLPRDLVTSVWLSEWSRPPTAAFRQRATRAIAQQFCASVEATGYRLEELGFFGASSQSQFGF